MVEAVIADQVAVGCDPCGESRVGLDPAALQEERGADAPRGEQLDDPGGAVLRRRMVRVLRIERERDEPLRPGGYLSTPVMTMPRVKKRWNAMNRTTGTTRVMRLPAWMKPGFW